MQKEEIYFLIIVLVMIVGLAYFLIKGLKRGEVWASPWITNKKEEPVLFWIALSFQVLLLLFFVAVLIFYIIYRFL